MIFLLMEESSVIFKMTQTTIKGKLKKIEFVEEDTIQKGVLAVITPKRIFKANDKAHHSRIIIDRNGEGKLSTEVMGVVSSEDIGKKVTYITDYFKLINKSIIAEELYVEGKLLLDYLIIKK